MTARDLRRIGVLIDASDRTTEAALWSALPGGVTLATARVSNPGQPGALTAGVDSVLTTKPQAVVIAVEDAGLGDGLTGLREAEHSLSAHAQIPVVTISGALVEWLLVRPWLRHLALVSSADLGTHEQFVRVLREASLRIGVGTDEPLIDAAATPQQVARAYRACADSGPDAIVGWGGHAFATAVDRFVPWTRSPVVCGGRALLEVALDRITRRQADEHLRKDGCW